jgi:hypothetical protein
MQEFASDTLATPTILTMGPASSITSDLHTDSQDQATTQVAIQRVESTTNSQLAPENPESSILEAIEVDTRPIWPGRLELIYKAYLAEKEAWLAANPTVRPTQYHKKRGLTNWANSICNQQKIFLPRDRLDLRTETLIEGPQTGRRRRSKPGLTGIRSRKKS